MNECLKCGQAGMRHVTHVCMTAGRVEPPYVVGAYIPCSECDALRARVAALEESGEGLDVAAAKMLRLSFSMDQKAMAAAWFKWLEIINDLTEACARWRVASSGAGEAEPHAGIEPGGSDDSPAAPDDPPAEEGA